MCPKDYDPYAPAPDPVSYYDELVQHEISLVDPNAWFQIKEDFEPLVEQPHVAEGPPPAEALEDLTGFDGGIESFDEPSVADDIEGFDADSELEEEDIDAGPPIPVEARPYDPPYGEPVVFDPGVPQHQFGEHAQALVPPTWGVARPGPVQEAPLDAPSSPYDRLPVSHSYSIKDCGCSGSQPSCGCGG